MRKRRVLHHYLALMMVLGWLCRSAVAFTAAKPNRIIVCLRPGVRIDLNSRGPVGVLGHPQLDAIGLQFGLRCIRTLAPGLANEPRAVKLGLDRTYVLTLDATSSPKAAAASFAAHPLVDYAEPDFRGSGAGVSYIPNDPYLPNQWGFRYTANSETDINAVEAWDVERGSEDVIVAILDSGIDWQHPDLDERIWHNSGEIPDNGIDDDDNGYVDDWRGWDFANDDSDPRDDHNHGTNVAGIIGAEANNDIGVAGLDWHCRLMASKNLDENNSGWYTWWISSILYAVRNGAHIINMSEGGISDSRTLANAINFAAEKGVLVVAAMMNSNDSTIFYPAAYAGTFAVGATDKNGKRASPFCWGGGSTWGDHIDVVAPGNYIYSTLKDGRYGSFCGTSQAAPMVSGLAALLLAQDSTRGPDDIATILRETARDQVADTTHDTPGWDKYYGHGLIDALAALGGGEAAVRSKSEARAATPEALELLGLHPNPVRSSSGRFGVSVGFCQAGGEDVVIEVRNSLGQLVARQHAEATPKATQHVYLPLDRGIQPGVYFLALRSGDSTLGTKFAVLP